MAAAVMVDADEWSNSARIRKLEVIVKTLQHKVATLHSHLTSEVRMPLPTRKREIWQFFDVIAGYVAEKHNVDLAVMRGPKRPHALAMARFECIWLMRKLTPASFPTIAIYFGRDHSTCVYGRDQVVKRIDGNAEYGRRLERWATELFAMGKPDEAD